VPVHIAASQITLGSELIVQGVFRDQREVQRAWEAVRVSQRQLQMVVSNVPVIIFLVDTEGIIQFADGRAMASANLTAEQLVGRAMLDTLQDSPEMRQSLASALSGGDSAAIFELNGRTFNLRLSPLRDDGQTVTGLVGVAADITARRRVEAALDAARLKLVNIREEEQKRVARELHDSIGQQLVAMKISLSSAGLADQAHRCVEMIHEVRRLCYDLYPPSLETLGLVAAIHQMGRHCEQGVKFEFDYPPQLEKARFGHDKEIAFFRVAQEAVNNAIRHGNADCIRVSLVRQDGRLDMIIADNGRGFDVAADAGSGLGIRNMTDRIRAVAGQINIDSRPGATTVHVSVPLASTLD